MEKLPLKLCGEVINPGEKVSTRLKMPDLFVPTASHVPVHVFNSEKKGPILFVCAGIHGDEICGIEIVRRLLKLKLMKNILKGTLIVLPIINLHGFLYQSRYLPDRRDLNRNFPGSKNGSAAARLAREFLNEVIIQCTHGIDLHSAAIHRINYPQIRINFAQNATQELAKAFNPPVIINSNLRDGSLRQATNDLDIPLLVYEAGEALRFDELSIRTGINGILNVLRHLEMIKGKSTDSKKEHPRPFISKKSTWVRAPVSGILQSNKNLGDCVKRGQTLGVLADPLSYTETPITAPYGGILIGQSTIPLLNEGEGVYHIAHVKQKKTKIAIKLKIKEKLIA